MNFLDRYNGIVRGEFKITAKNKEGEVVYEYEDNNLVVNDAKHRRVEVSLIASEKCKKTANYRQGKQSKKVVEDENGKLKIDW